MSDASRHKMSQIEEVTYGVTPATPVLTPIRHTGTTLGLSKDSSASEELHDNRQIKCFRHGMRQVGGDINIEFSAGAFDDQLEAAFGGTWATDALTEGVNRRSFSILREFTDLESADKPFHLFVGCEYNTFTLTITPNAIVTGSFGLVGQDLGLNTVEPTGATYNPLTTDCPFDGFTGEVTEGGVGLGIVTEITLTLDNGLEVRPVVGDDKTLEPTIGMTNLSGVMTVYFENADLLEKFIDETASSLVIQLDHSGDQYIFDLPEIIYTGGQPDIAGPGEITLSMPFQALFNESAGYTIEITRALL